MRNPAHATPRDGSAAPRTIQNMTPTRQANDPTPPLEYATFLRRISGYLIDLALFLPLNIAAAIWLIVPVVSDFNALFLDGTVTDADMQEFTGTLAAATIPALVASIGVNLLFNAYYVVCLGWVGRTLGGQILGLRCVSHNGDKATWGQVSLRQGFSFTLNTVTALLPGGGLISLVNPGWMLFDSKRQMLMDKVGRTLVIRVRRTSGPTQTGAESRPEGPSQVAHGGNATPSLTPTEESR